MGLPRKEGPFFLVNLGKISLMRKSCFLLLPVFVFLQNLAATIPFSYYPVHSGISELTVKATPPSFLREGDRINFTADIRNASDTELTGQVELQLIDPVSNQSVDGWFRNFYPNQYFTVPAKGLVQASFSLEVPYQYTRLLRYKVIIRSGTQIHHDENQLPVLSSRMLLTESLPLSMQSSISKNFVFEKLRNSGQQESIQHQSFTIEWSSEPIGFILQALPSLYSNNPVSSEEILYSLIAEQVYLILHQQKNKESKLWILRDSIQCVHNSDTLLRKLQEYQSAEGAFTWLKGTGAEDPFLTLKIMEELGWLNQTTAIAKNSLFQSICTKAIGYLDAQILSSIKKKSQTGSYEFQYVLLRKQFPEIVLPSNLQAVFLKITQQSFQHWQQMAPAQQATVALLAYSNHQDTLANNILHELEKQALQPGNQTLYWKDATIENQALMINAFTIAKNNRNRLFEMTRWILNQKNKDCWTTTSSTAAAIHTLLLIANQTLPPKMQTGISAGKILISEDSTETGIQYFRKSLAGEQINPLLADIKVTQKANQKSTDTSLNWGAAYWSYLEPLENIVQDSTPLKLQKKVYLSKRINGKKTLQLLQDGTEVKTGDTLLVKLFITAKRSIDYILLKESLFANAQPILASKGFQQKELAYYLSQEEGNLSYYFNRLPQGNHQLEYLFSVTHAGEYSSGISSIQCLHQPTIQSHAQSGRLSVETRTP